MIKYQVSLNKGVEAFGTGPSITANEIVDTADASALAREIHHLNSLIPEQVAEAVLQNFCEAAANLMAMGYAVVLRSGADAAIRIYPDVHVKGGNINLDRAKALIPGTVALSLDNAGELVTKAGVTFRAKAECEPKFNDLLTKAEARLERKEVVEKAFVKRANASGDDAAEEGGGTPGGSGSDSGSGNNGGSGSDSGSGNGGSTGGSTGGGSGSATKPGGGGPVIDV